MRKNTPRRPQKYLTTLRHHNTTMAFPGVQPKSTEDRLRMVVMLAEQHVGDEQPVELEVRFGRIRGKSFEPGLSEDDLHRVEALLDTYNNWSEGETDWYRSHVFYHGSSIPGDKRELRTEKVYRSTTQEDVTCVEKRSLQKVNFSVAVLDENASSLSVVEDGPAIDFRVSVAIEHPVPKDDIPMAVRTDRCVVKLRREFLYTPLDRRSPVWGIHLTKRWTASTLVEAFHVSARDPPQCDIELELLDTNYLLTKGSDTTTCKMVWKIYNIIEAIYGHVLHQEEFSIHAAAAR
jgi:hypothetical protein